MFYDYIEIEDVAGPVCRPMAAAGPPLVKAR